LKKFGKYEVLGELGHGAMGVVYRARDPLINRLVALKTITTGVAADPALLQRFYREAQSAGGLQHPNIVTIYDLGEEGHLPYIAMELVEGENLEQVIARRAALPISLKLVYAVQACRAFDYAHKRGIVHRDIKPGNVMVSKDGVVKVVDFGIARVLETSKTQTGMLIGTFSYMSPEQYHGEHADERSDIWSFGVLLYELLGYQRPFMGETPASLMHSICQQEPSSLNKLVPDCPQELEPIVTKVLRKDPNDRYQSMEDLLLELDPLCKKLQALSVGEFVARSQRHVEQNEFTEARELLRQALQIESGNQQARALLERANAEIKRIQVRPKAQQYVERGRAFLGEGRIQEAKVAAENALQLDSGFAPAQELQRIVREELERAQLVIGWLQTAKQHLAEGLPEEAEALVAKVLQAEPSNQQAVALQEQVAKEKAERQKRLRLLEKLQEARGLWTRQNYRECILLLVDLGKEFPDEEEIPKLLETVREDQAEQQKQQALLDARNLLAAGRHEESLAQLMNLRKQFPRDDEIPRMLEDVRKDQMNQRRLQGLRDARSVLAAGQYDDCISRLTALRKEFPDEPEIPKLIETAREYQVEEHRQQGVAEARKLLSARRYTECTSMLAALQKQFPDDDEIARLQDAVREEQAEQRKLQGLAEARSLLASRSYEKCIALLSSMQREFPEEDEIRKLRESAQDEQAQQRKREGLTQARNLLASRRYGESITVLSQLQAEFPGEAEITKLLETAGADQAEQQKQQQLAEARALLAAQSFSEALVLLEALATAHPKDSGVLKLRALVQREQEKHATAERIQREVEALKKLMNEKKYADVLSRTKELLAEFPSETNFRRLAEFAHSQQAHIEKELLLRKTLAETKALFDANRFQEAMQAAEIGLKTFPSNLELTNLSQQAEISQRKLQVRQQIERRIREIRVKINREKFSDAIDLAKQTLASFGPDTDVTQLLNSAQVEFDAREKQRERERRLEEIHTLIETGKLEAASQAIDEAIQTNVIEAFDPRIQRLSAQIKEAQTVAAQESTPAPPAVLPSISKEYAFLEAAPSPSAPAPSEKTPTADAPTVLASASHPVAVPQPASPGNPPEPAPLAPASDIQPALNVGAPKQFHAAPDIAVQPLEMKERPVPSPSARPAQTPAIPHPMLHKFAAVAVTLGVIAAGWAGIRLIRSTPRPVGAPSTKPNVSPATPPINPLEVKQRDALNAADKLIAANDLEGALQKLREMGLPNGPLTPEVRKKMSAVEESMKDANLRQLRQREEVLWQQAMNHLASGHYPDARKNLRQVLALPVGGVRREEAQNFLDKVIPQRILQNDLLAQARQNLKQGDFQSARRAADQLRQNGGDPAPLVAQIDEAEQSSLAQLESQFNQLEQRDDDAAVQQLKALLPKFKVLAADGGPQSTEALNYANRVPRVLSEVQARVQKKSADAEFQQTVQRYQQAASAADKNGLAAARTSFQSIVQGGGPHANDAQKYLTELDSKVAALNQPSAAAVKPPAKPEIPPVSTVGADSAIRTAIQRYANAFSQRDADALRQVWPSMGSRYERYKSTFAAASSIRMRVDIDRVEVGPDGTTALVKGRVSQDYTPKGSKTRSSQDVVTFRLAKAEGPWIITDVQ